MDYSQTSIHRITEMDLHKLVFEVKGLGCIVNEDSGFWEQLEAQFSSFYSICKSIRSSTTTLRFRLWAISERITPNCEERQGEKGGVSSGALSGPRTRRIYWKLSSRPENECWMRVKDVSSSLRLSTADVSANAGYFIQHVAPYCLGIVSFRLVTDEDNYVHGEGGLVQEKSYRRECKKVSWISRSSQLT